MICFNYFKPQRENDKGKRGVLCFICGEKIKDWPTNRIGQID